MKSKKQQTAVVAVATVLSVSSAVHPVAIQAQEKEVVNKAYQTETEATIQTKGNKTTKALNADGSVDINDTNFPDKNFRSYVRRNLDKDKDWKLSKDEIEQIKKIDVRKEIGTDKNNKITSLKGIEYFTELNYLFCSKNLIQELDISKNKKLINLICNENLIEKINLESNPELKELDCKNNLIQELDISKNKELKNLECSENLIEKINLESNPNLKELICNNNLIQELDLSKNKELQKLDCSNTNIETLDVSKNSYLYNLNCAGNKNIKELYLRENTKLKFLQCNGNQLTSLDVSGNPELNSLQCNENQLTSLNVSGNLILESLQCNGNQLTSLDVSKNSELSLLRCNGNQLTSLDVSGNPILESLQCNENQLTSLVLSGYQKLKSLQCNGNQLTSLVLSGNPELSSLQCNENQLTSLALSGNPKLSYLKCSGNQLTSLDVSGNSILGYLQCNGNQLQSLDVSNNQSLARLECKENPLMFLEIGEDGYSIIVNLPDPPATKVLENINEDSFYIQNKINGIDFKKVKIESGAEYDVTTGEVSGYTKDELIRYTYYCGERANGWKGMQTAYLSIPDAKGKSYISIEDKLNKVYDGNSVSEPKNVKITGSDGAVSFIWEDSKSGTWERMTSMPTEAGYYRVIANVAANDDFAGATSEPLYFIISKADSTINITSKVEDLSKTYDGEVIMDPSYDKFGSTGKVTIIWETGNDTEGWTKLDTAPMNVGTYRVTLKLVSDDNYRSATSDSIEFTITQANRTITVNQNLNKEYDDKAVSPSVEHVGEGEVTYTWEKKTEEDKWVAMNSIPTEAGTYRVKAHITALGNYTSATSEPLEFAISKADSTIDITSKVEDLSKTYNKEAVINPSYNKFGSTGEVTIIWETGNDTEGWTKLDTAPMNVGTYRVTLKLAGDDNYKAAESKPVKFVITQANRTITVNQNLNKQYDGKAVHENPSVEHVDEGEVTYTWEKKTEKDNWVAINSIPTEAGTYRVKAHITASGNYTEATSDFVEFTITQANRTITVNQNLNKQYDGKAVHENPSVEHVGEGEVTYTWEKKTEKDNWVVMNSIPTEAGTYRVKAHITALGNYTEATSDFVEFTIAQANRTITVNQNLNKQYDGQAVDPSVEHVGEGEITYTWEKKTEEDKWVAMNSIPTEAGTYRVKAHIAALGNYTSATSESSEFMISKADSTIDITSKVEDLSKTYDGEVIKDPSVDTTGSTGTVSYIWEKKDGNTWVSVDNACEVGTYRVSAKLATDQNYLSETSNPVEFTIDKADNEWKEELSIDDWIYGEVASKPSAKAKFGEVKYTYSNTETGQFSEEVPTTAGKWYVKATIEGTDNFNGLEIVTSFVIDQAKANLILPSHLNGVKGANLGTVLLPNGWTWVDGTQILKVVNDGYLARIVVDDKNYDFSEVEGYSPREHYVERTLDVVVSKAVNSWVKEPSIVDWVYGETASQPTVEAKNGEAVITYSDAKDGTFVSEVPTTAGTWYMKVNVEADDEFTGLEQIVEFTIEKAIPSYEVPEDLKTFYGSTLKDIELPKGYAWVDETLLVGDAGVQTCKAIYTPEDTKNYKAIEVNLNVKVEQAQNKMIDVLVINHWTYGEEPSTPSIKFLFGKIRMLYSDEANGVFVEEMPTTAGTWYVKAVVDGTDNYTGIESDVVSFHIEPKQIQGSEIPEMNAEVNLEEIHLKNGNKVLVQGVDYDVKKVEKGNEVTVTLTFKGNYAGTVEKTYQLDRPSKDTGVETGDTTAKGVWAMFMCLAAGMMAAIRRKKQK